MVMDHLRIRSLTLQNRADELSVFNFQFSAKTAVGMINPPTANRQLTTIVRPSLESQATAPGLREYTPAPATRRLLTWLLLATAGCQSVVDPGRSMRPAPAPTSPGVIVPGGPAFPSTPVPDGSSAGVERQPVAAVLKLPQANSTESKYHTVKAGDSWSSVAQQYHLTVPELTTANGIDPSTVLQPGQMIYIPEK